MSTDSERIAELLLKAGAVLIRPAKPFTWASGIQSPIYCDNRLLLSSPRARTEVIDAFLKLLRKKRLKFDVIAGIATAGIPYAAILADRLKKPLIYVRPKPKDHGKKGQIEGRLEKGSRVLMIEDLVSTGGSSLNAVKAIRQAGSKVSDCLAVFSYNLQKSQTAFRQGKCRIHTLSGLVTLLKVAVREKVIGSKEKDLVERFITQM